MTFITMMIACSVVQPQDPMMAMAVSADPKNENDTGCNWRLVREDKDQDGWGIGPLRSICDMEDGTWSAEAETHLGDCDDEDPEVYGPSNPSHYEICNGIDDDCDGFVDVIDFFDIQEPTWYYYWDMDGDGYGQGDGMKSCFDPIGVIPNTTRVGVRDFLGDCNDYNASLYPGHGC